MSVLPKNDPAVLAARKIAIQRWSMVRLGVIPPETNVSLGLMRCPKCRAPTEATIYVTSTSTAEMHVLCPCGFSDFKDISKGMQLPTIGGDVPGSLSLDGSAVPGA